MKARISFTIILLFVSFTGFSQVNIPAARALIKRIIPNYAGLFLIESLNTQDKDAFEIESLHQKIVLRGNNGVAIASALYYYLNTFCHCQITWNGTNLKLPKKLPTVNKKVHSSTPYEYRYYLNYCT